MNPLENALAEREILLRKLQAIDASIELLRPVYGDTLPEAEIDVSRGLTHAVRGIMQHSSGKLWSPTEMRDRLLRNGYDFGLQANPLASIHTVLKRIAASGDWGYSAVEGDNGNLYKFDLAFKPVNTVSATKREENK